MAVACASAITSVEVYARGAVVTRRVELPAGGLPSEPCELVVGGLTPQAEPASLRAEVAGGRPLVGVRSRAVLPVAPPPADDLQEQRRTLSQRIGRVTRERDRLHARLRGLEPVVPARRPRRSADPAVRAAEMLAAARLVRELEEQLDAALTERDAELEGLLEEQARLDAALARRDPEPEAGAASATREVVVRLGPGADPEGVTIRYVVAAARWWPAYAARIDEGGAEAELSLDALVVQATGEPWTGVQLALSTAELTTDARLPQLPSLRFGRRQPPPRTGYRPPPEGLDQLFAGYDGAASPPRTRRAPAAPPPPLQAQPKAEWARSEAIADRVTGAAFDEDEAELAALADDGAPAAEIADLEVDAFAPPEPALRMQSAMPRGRRALFGSGAAPSRPPAPAPEKQRRASPGGPDGGAPELPLEPGDAWLDFDSLVLGPNDDRRRRGRLVRDPGPEVASYRAAGLRAIDAAPAPRFARDPHQARGRFDHRFAAEGLADVASGDVPQRVGVCRAKAPCRQRLVAVPVEDEAVYREAELDNPFEAPLLGGPVDVFVGASLLTTTSLGKVGRGGGVRFGLGVEERVRVARNVRVEESTSGFLSGVTHVEHRVSLDVRSSLPGEVELRVVDRVPVSGDEELTVEVLESSPAAEPYPQTERGTRVEGGLAWSLTLPPGGERALSFAYRIDLPAKREVVGGNRRD